MKGIIFCTLLVSLIHFSLTKTYSCENHEMGTSDDFAACGREGHSLSEDDRKDFGWTHCCLFIFDNGTSYCYGLTDDQYEHIKNFKKYLNEFGGESEEIDKIKCGSNYLSYSLFIIVLFALIF